MGASPLHLKSTAGPAKVDFWAKVKVGPVWRGFRVHLEEENNKDLLTLHSIATQQNACSHVASRIRLQVSSSIVIAGLESLFF